MKEFFKLLLFSLAIVIPFRLFIAQPFVVEGASMYPTFKNGDYLIVDELSLRFTKPERGDVLVFRYPKDPRKSFIKRLRSEEHTSELQSHVNLVCRLLLA